MIGYASRPGKNLLLNYMSDFIDKHNIILVVISLEKFVIVVIRVLMHPWYSYSYGFFKNIIFFLLFFKNSKSRVYQHITNTQQLKGCWCPIFFSSPKNWLFEKYFLKCVKILTFLWSTFNVKFFILWKSTFLSECVKNI